jgi:chemotaxis signal transduction protein
MTKGVRDPQEAPVDRHEQRRSFFRHPIPPGYADEMAEVLARVPEAEPERSGAMLVFQVAELRVAVPARMVRGVSRPLPPSPLPHRRSGPVLGLVGFRGEVLPCCSLVRLMGVADSAGTDAQGRTLVLTDRDGEGWAIPVDAVLGILTGSLRDRRSADRLSDYDVSWTDGVFDDDHGLVAYALRTEVLFERMKRALA